MEATYSEPQPINRRKIFSETRRVLNSQRRTFVALAFLFLVPSAFAAVLYPILAKSLSPAPAPAPVPEDQPTSSTSIPAKITLLNVAYILFNLVFSPCAVGSITYTAFHAFHGEPVKLKAAVKSIAVSFFPLIATNLTAHVITFAVIFAFAIFVIIITTTSALLGFLAPPYLLAFPMAVFAIVLLMYIQLNWILASAVVVAESSWGFAPLKRSKTLIKGKRGLALCLTLIFGVCYLVFYWSSRYTADFAAILDGTASRAEWIRFFLDLTLKFSCGSALLTLTNLYNLIAITVLYVYCTPINHGASGKFSGEYFSLPVDDEKVASLV